MRTDAWGPGGQQVVEQILLLSRRKQVTSLDGGPAGSFLCQLFTHSFWAKGPAGGQFLKECGQQRGRVLLKKWFWKRPHHETVPTKGLHLKPQVRKQAQVGDQQLCLTEGQIQTHQG